MTLLTDIPDARLPDLFSDALDEIYRLRAASAYEATVLQEHLTFKTFPQPRRRYGEEQVQRMFDVARGHVERAYAGTSSLSLDHAAPEPRWGYLTADEWAAVQPLPQHPFRPRPVTDEEAEELSDDLRRAVNEIRQLRRGIAYEALVLRAHLSASFPRTRAAVLEVQATRMLAAAAGNVEETYSGPLHLQLRGGLKAAGASPVLTSDQWLSERPRRRG